MTFRSILVTCPFTVIKLFELGPGWRRFLSKTIKITPNTLENKKISQTFSVYTNIFRYISLVENQRYAVYRAVLNLFNATVGAFRCRAWSWRGQDSVFFSSSAHQLTNSIFANPKCLKINFVHCFYHITDLKI